MTNPEEAKADQENSDLNEREARSLRRLAYAQEHEEVPRLLFELCRQLESPRHDSRGPKPLPLGEQIQCLVMKIFSRYSPARSVKIVEQMEKKGFISRTPSANSVIQYFNSTKITKTLHLLIGWSSRPMIPYETCFGFDGSPFQMRDYLDYTGTYTADRANGHRYIMLHVIAGLNTKIVPAAAVDVCVEKYFHLKHDSQFVEELVRRTKSLGFKISALWGDKAYYSLKSKQLVKDVGAEDHLTRRRKRGEKRKGAAKTEPPDPQMRKRNGVETVFSMIKQIFGGSVSSRNKVALINEALCMVLANNLRILVHQSIKNSVEIKFEKPESKRSE